MTEILLLHWNHLQAKISLQFDQFHMWSKKNALKNLQMQSCSTKCVVSGPLRVDRSKWINTGPHFCSSYFNVFSRVARFLFMMVAVHDFSVQKKKCTAKPFKDSMSSRKIQFMVQKKKLWSWFWEIGTSDCGNPLSDLLKKKKKG